MNTIIALLSWLTGRQAPVPPGTAQRIQAREQRAAKNRLLDLAEQRAAQHLYDGPTR